MIDSIIEEAFNSALNTFATSQAIQVAWPNVPFTPTTGKAYMRPSLLPAATVQASLGSGGDNRHTGIYQVSIFYPEKSGMTVRQKADALMSVFRLGTRLTRGGVIVRVHRPPFGAPGLQEAGWYQIPVSIPYESDVTNGDLP